MGKSLEQACQQILAVLKENAQSRETVQLSMVIDCYQGGVTKLVISKSKDYMKFPEKKGLDS